MDLKGRNENFFVINDRIVHVENPNKLIPKRNPGIKNM